MIVNWTNICYKIPAWTKHETIQKWQQTEWLFTTLVKKAVTGHKTNTIQSGI